MADDIKTVCPQFQFLVVVVVVVVEWMILLLKINFVNILLI